MHIINSSGLGGAETVLLNIMLHRSDFCFCLHETRVQRFTNLGDRVKFGTKSIYFKYNPFVLFRLINFVNKTGVRILHVHLANALFYTFLVKMLFPKIKIIYHEHGEIQYNKYLKLLLKCIYKDLDVIIAVSEQTKQQLRGSNISMEKLVLLRNFVDLSYFSPKKKDLMRSGEYIVGFAGRIVEIKGWRDYLEAIALIQKDGLEIKFLIAGDGDQKDQMLNMIKELNIEQSVSYLGYFSAMRDFYSLLDCFVLPSYFEASPMSLIEAQAMGVLTLSSNIPSIKEIITDGVNGMLFEKGNATDLSEKIRIAHSDRQLSLDTALNGLNFVQEFSLSNYLVRLEDVYSSLSM